MDIKFVSYPLEIKKQSFPDECVSCAIASIKEDTFGKIVDPKPLYQLTDDSGFGQLPQVVCDKAIELGWFKSKHKVWCFNWFDGIKNKIEQGYSVLTGCFWQPEWNKKKDGIVDSFYQNLTIFPHAFKVCGFCEKNGIIYLVVQNSGGVEVGDNGFFYFPREIASKFHFAYYFKN